MLAQDNLSKEATLTQLFNNSERTINQGEYAKALKSIDKILNLSPNDIDVERAYCLYRLNKFSEGTELLHKYRTAKNNDNGLRHLEAQV
ncbi:463_t:CDS:2, partial [Scutellospora calospora]